MNNNDKYIDKKSNYWLTYLLFTSDHLPLRMNVNKTDDNMKF